ncbi:MAG: hypothetical protein JNM56_40215 [Planctomycetia bacterium]|nr:hypothetical protein [Planctomycetia bacterium]
MTELERGELFAALAELARRYPHWRVGQLVANVAGWADAEVWDAEDGQLLAAARAHLTVGPKQALHLTGEAAQISETL